MISRDGINDWEKEFDNFQQTNPVQPPPKVRVSVVNLVRSSLSPSPFQVFAKLVVAVFFSSLVSLSICPQLGFSLANSTFLMDILMKYGRSWCTFICGATFMFLGVAISALLLRYEDLRAIRKHRFLQLSALSALMLGFFVTSGPGVVISVALQWFVGALVGGLITLEVSCLLYRRSFTHFSS